MDKLIPSIEDIRNAKVVKIHKGVDNDDSPPEWMDDGVSNNDAMPWKSTCDRIMGLGERLIRLPTGFSTLDQATRGGPATKKRLFLVGPPGSNKTGIALFLACKYLMEGAAVVILAADEDADSLLIRMGQMLEYEREALEEPDHQFHGWSKADYATKMRDRAFIIVDGDESADATIEKCSEELTRISSGRPSVLIVDSIQRARSEYSDDAVDARLRTNEVVKALKQATKAGHLVIATCEANRANYASRMKQNRGTALAAAKESSDIEYAASVMLVLSSVEGTSDEIDVEIAKNRMGRKGITFRLKLDFRTSSYIETEGEAEIDEDAKRADEYRQKLNKTKKSILDFVRSNPGKSKRSIAAAVKGTASHVWTCFDLLLDDGVIHLKKGRTGGSAVYLGAAPDDEALLVTNEEA